MASKGEEDKLLTQTAATDDNFYDTTDITTPPEYDNVVNAGVAEEQDIDPEERARQQEEWQTELAKLEDEITTLRQVLGAKVRQSNELKRNLGITPIAEFKHDLKQGITNIKESNAYQKSSEKLHQVSDKISHSDAYQKTNAAFKTVGQKTSTALSTVGAFASRKLGDVRNSQTFKSFEEKVGGAVSSVKTRVSGSKSESSFEDVLNSTANAERDDGPLSNPTMPTTLPEEKVPL